LKRGANGLYDTWLILGGETFEHDSLRTHHRLSLQLTGTNGDLPRTALQGSLFDGPALAGQTKVHIRNLSAPTLPCYPPNRDRFHWRVLGHMGSNFLSLLDNAEVVRGTLALYEWTGSEMNQRRLKSIIEVKHFLLERFERGLLLRGVDIEVTLNSDGFSGGGDISLFGEMLSRFFGLYADIHLFTRLTLILKPSGERLRYGEMHSKRVPG
jgi:type VI secretion system protein ImpG